jgi:hypothetical protein
VLRGLLLDLLVTGDRRGVDAAFEHFWSSEPSPSGPIVKDETNLSGFQHDLTGRCMLPRQSGYKGVAKSKVG